MSLTDAEIVAAITTLRHPAEQESILKSLQSDGEIICGLGDFRAIESAVLAKIATTPAASPIPIDAPVLDEDGRQVRVRPGEVEKGREHARYLLALLNRTAWAMHDSDCAENEWQAATTCEIISLVAKAAASTTPEPSPLVAPKPLPGELVIKAIRATDAEASRRGEMFPQTSDEQDDDRKAVCRVIGMMEFYTSERQSRDGWPSVKDWPALPAAPVRATEGEA